MPDRTQRQVQKVTLQRKAIRKNTEEELERLKDVLKADSLDQAELQAQIQKVQHFSDQLPVLDNEILENLLTTEDDLEPEIQGVAEFQRQVVDVVKTAESRLAPPLPDPDPDGGSVGGSTVHGGPLLTPNQPKLSKLELPSFAGDPVKWQAFWDSFASKVHDDAAIAEVDKLHYLLKLLEGEAEEAVAGYRPTASNYQVIVSVLKERFGNPETAKFKNFEALFALPSAETEPSKLKDIYNEL